jgi:hypothetical protein
MSVKAVFLLTIVSSVVCPSVADARFGKVRGYRCRSASQGANCAPTDTANLVRPLKPLEVEEVYSVQVPTYEEVIGPDGKPRKVIKYHAEERARTRVLRTANEQIEYLLDQLYELDRDRITPLETRVEKIEGRNP